MHRLLTDCSPAEIIKAGKAHWDSVLTKRDALMSPLAYQYRRFQPLPLVPTLHKLCECLALIDAGYLTSTDPLWRKRG